MMGAEDGRSRRRPRLGFMLLLWGAEVGGMRVPMDRHERELVSENAIENAANSCSLYHDVSMLRKPSAVAKRSRDLAL